MESRKQKAESGKAGKRKLKAENANSNLKPKLKMAGEVTMRPPGNHADDDDDEPPPDYLTSD